MNSMFDAIVLSVLALMATSVSSFAGERPFFMIETCLKDDESFDVFTNIMKTIANSEMTHFTDDSLQTQTDLKEMSVTTPQTRPGWRVVNIAVEREDGMGVTAGNLGLARHQIALGFSAGLDLKQARQFADIFIGASKHVWPVEGIPADSGAMAYPGIQKSPLPSCMDHESSGLLIKHKSRHPSG